MTWALLLGLLAKSSVVAGVGLIASRWAVRRAADRVDVLRLTLGLLAALPLIAMFGPQLPVALPFFTDLGPIDMGETPGGPDPLWVGSTPPVAGLMASGVVWRPSLLAVLACVWAIGGLLIVARLALGVWALRQWTRAGRPVHDPAWTDQFRRLDRSSRPRLVVSSEVSGPLSWGLSPGSILLDTDSLESPGAAAAILAHEMAHLKRADWAFLMVSRLVLALFWFNPLVWWLTRSLVDRSEEAADAQAVSHVDRHAYARALISLAAAPTASHIHPTGAIAMAAQPHSLKKRIACIMNAPKADPRRPVIVGLTIAALFALATPLAALDLHGRAPMPPAPPQAPVAPEAPTPPSPPVSPAHEDRVAPPPPPVPPAPPELAAGDEGLPSAPPAPPEPPVPPVQPRGSRTSTHTVWSNDNGRYVITTDGVTRDATPEERAQMDAARERATEARARAEDARLRAGQARARAGEAQGQARAIAARLGDQRLSPAEEQGRGLGARAASEHARAIAAQARRSSLQAREQARLHMASSRVDMRNGAQTMRDGAAEMRRESVRLRDPAYRARQIERNRGQGRVVTDAELVALSPRLESRAAEMDRRADALARRGAETR